MHLNGAVCEPKTRSASECRSTTSLICNRFHCDKWDCRAKAVREKLGRWSRITRVASNLPWARSTCLSSKAFDRKGNQ